MLTAPADAIDWDRPPAGLVGAAASPSRKEAGRALLARGLDGVELVDSHAVAREPSMLAPAEIAEMQDAATLLQSRVRGMRSRVRMRVELARAFSPPELEKAKAHARSYLPHDQNRKLLPLNCPMKCFQARATFPCATPRKLAAPLS